MTLRSRVIAIVAGLVIAGIAIASLVAYTSAGRELHGATDRFLTNRSNEVIGGLRPAPRPNDNDPNNNDPNNNDPNNRDQASSLDLPFDPDAFAQSLDRSGSVVASGGVVLPVGPRDVAVAKGAPAVIRNIEVDGVSYRMITAPNRKSGGAVQIARELTTTNSVLSALRWRLLVVTAVLAAIAAMLGWLLMRRATQPLEDLAGAAERVAATGDLAPIGLDRDDEVGRLANSFDRMLAALSTSREQQRRLVQDAGHELRTPLTSLRANIEFLERAPDLPADQRAELLAALRSESEELGHLVNEVIDLASGDLSAAVPETDVDLAAIVLEAVERFRRRTDRTVEVEIEHVVEPLIVTGVPSLLDRAIANLLGNAHKFSPPDTPIEVRLAGRRVSVRDHGPGIAAADLDRIFDRFYRSDAARSQPGSGLGLAIVRQIAEQHGGSVHATNAPGGGAEVSFTV